MSPEEFLAATSEGVEVALKFAAMASDFSIGDLLAAYRTHSTSKAGTTTCFQDLLGNEEAAADETDWVADHGKTPGRPQ